MNKDVFKSAITKILYNSNMKYLLHLGWHLLSHCKYHHIPDILQPSGIWYNRYLDPPLQGETVKYQILNIFQLPSFLQCDIHKEKGVPHLQVKENTNEMSCVFAPLRA